MEYILVCFNRKPIKISLNIIAIAGKIIPKKLRVNTENHPKLSVIKREI